MLDVHEISRQRVDHSERAALVSPLARQQNFRPLVEWFVRGLDLRLDTMEQAWRTAAWPELATLAHQLKGAGASYGYPTISEAAHRLETAARSEAAGEVELQYDALRQECDAAARGIERLESV